MNALGYLIGAGSMTLGVEQAGFTVREVWETPGYGLNAQTWDLNRPQQRHHELELNHHDTHTVASRGAFDLIYGNPPCGGVSAMTCSRMESPTNNCMRQWIRMVAAARPRAILMENGYQLATDRMALLLLDLTNVLDHYGYHWWTWSFYSYQLGTPQIRRRMFLCATLDPPQRVELLDLRDLPPNDKHLSAPGHALWALTGVTPSPQPVVDREGRTVTQHWYDSDRTAVRNELVNQHWERLREPYVTPYEVQVAQQKIAEGSEPYAKWLKQHYKRLWADCPPDFAQKMHMHRPTRVDWDQACGAIIGFFKFVHPVDRRFLTMREMANLMGYPVDWQFHELSPHLIAQGIPVANARWGAYRLAQVAGWA